MLAVGSWRPDIADTNAGVARRALNVLLKRDEDGLAHGPMPGLSVVATAEPLPGDPKGGVSVVNAQGSYAVVIGTTNALYLLEADYTWDLIGSGYSLPDGANWSFTRFGDFLYATNANDGMLKYDVEVGTAVDPVVGAPEAKFIFTMFNTVFALACDGDERLIRNSAIGNADLWKSGEKGSGSQSLADGENLVCGVELSPDFGIILQRNAIRGVYRRYDSKLYDLKLIASERGCVSASSLVSADGMAFWWDTDGPYMINAGGQITAIGEGKVAKTIIASMGGDGLRTIEGGVDKVNNRVVWRYKAASDTSDTVFSRAIAYDYLLGEWSEIEVETTAIFTLATPGYTMDNIDVYGSIDDLPASLDSRFWAGGEPRIAALTPDGKIAFFDGDNMASLSETGTKIAMQSALFTSVTPISDAASATIRIGVRDRLADLVTWKAPVAVKRSGRCPVRGRGKAVCFQHETAAGDTWTAFRGIDGVDAALGGPR